MARMSPFSSPLLLGFDRLEEMLTRPAVPEIVKTVPISGANGAGS